MLDKLTSRDFLPLIHQDFCIQLEGIEPIPLELVSVTELGEARQPDLRRPFSLLFLGPTSNQYLRQHMYSLEHPQMETLELFLVPLGLQAGRMRYEAIFN